MNSSSPYKICPRCSTPNRMEAQFCGRCGLPFTQGRSPYPGNGSGPAPRSARPQGQNPYPRPASPYPQGSGQRPNPAAYPRTPQNAPVRSPRPVSPAPAPAPRRPKRRKKSPLIPILIGLTVLLAVVLAAALFLLFKNRTKDPSAPSSAAVTASSTSGNSSGQTQTAAGETIRFAYLLKEDHAELSSYSLYQNGSSSKGYKAFTDSFQGGTYTVPDKIEGLPVTTINTYAFYNPYASDPSVTGSLQVVNLPDTVTFIDKNPFGGLSSLTEIHIASPDYYDVDGVLCGKVTGPEGSVQTGLIQYPLGKTAESYTVPDGITVISDQAFAGSPSLKEVSLPEGVREIRLYAFSGMPGLSRLSLPASLTTIQNATWIDGSPVSEILLASGNTHFTAGTDTLTGTNGTVYWTR